MKAELIKHILFAIFLVGFAAGGTFFAFSGGKEKLFALVDASTTNTEETPTSSVATTTELSLEISTAVPVTEKTTPAKKKISIIEEVKKFFSPHSESDTSLSIEQNSSATSSPSETNAEPSIPKPTPITAPFVYLDSLLAGWKIDTSSAQVNIKSPIYYRGEVGIEAVFTSPQDKLYLKNDAGIHVENGGYDGLMFAIRGEKGGEKVTLLTYDTEGKLLGATSLIKYLRTQKITTEYIQAYVPFRSLGAEKKVIGQIVFQSDAPNTIYLDDISFTAQPSLMPTYTSGHTTTAEVYTDELGVDWEISSRDVGWESKDGAIGATFAKENASLTLSDSLGMDTHTYHHFVIVMKGWDALPVQLSMYDTNGVMIGNVSLRDYLRTEDGKLGDYQTISIPLSDLNADGAVLGSIVFWSDTEAANIYFGDLRFTY